MLPEPFREMRMGAEAHLNAQPRQARLRSWLAATSPAPSDSPFIATDDTDGTGNT